MSRLRLAGRCFEVRPPRAPQNRAEVAAANAAAPLHTTIAVLSSAQPQRRLLLPPPDVQLCSRSERMPCIAPLLQAEA